MTNKIIPVITILIILLTACSGTKDNQDRKIDNYNYIEINDLIKKIFPDLFLPREMSFLRTVFSCLI